MGGAKRWKRLVPHPHVVDKIWEGYLGFLLETRPLSPEFQSKEDK